MPAARSRSIDFCYAPKRVPQSNPNDAKQAIDQRAMPKPGELAALTAELREKAPQCRFTFEWSSPAQGKHLLLCGDWNRQGRRTSRTIQDPEGKPIKKGARQLSTEQRVRALEAATSLVHSYLDGSAAKQRRKRALEPSSSLLEQQRKRLVRMIRERDGGHGVKSKHLRHVQSLFNWLDERNCYLDSATAINWAGDGVTQDTDNYSDRLRVAQWACIVNQIGWIVPPQKRAKKPTVKRPFVDKMVGQDLSSLFRLITNPEAEAFFRVIAATGCRPSEVLCYDWKSWDEAGRPNTVDGYSRKIKKKFRSIIHPCEWLKDLDIDTLHTEWTHEELESADETISDALTKRYSRLLKLIQKDFKAAGIQHKPTWTCIRHLWTVRAELDGLNRHIGALSQAHSLKMATYVYLRHGAKGQVLAEAKRFARMRSEAA